MYVNNVNALQNMLQGMGSVVSALQNSQAKVNAQLTQLQSRIDGGDVGAPGGPSGNASGSPDMYSSLSPASQWMDDAVMDSKMMALVEDKVIPRLDSEIFSRLDAKLRNELLSVLRSDIKDLAQATAAAHIESLENRIADLDSKFSAASAGAANAANATDAANAAHERHEHLEGLVRALDSLVRGQQLALDELRAHVQEMRASSIITVSGDEGAAAAASGDQEREEQLQARLTQYIDAQIAAGVKAAVAPAPSASAAPAPAAPAPAAPAPPATVTRGRGGKKTSAAAAAAAAASAAASLTIE